MQRWFYAEEAEACDAMPSPAASVSTAIPTATRRCGEEEGMWRFCVLMHEKYPLLGNERVAVVGSCESLGSWQLGGCVLLTKEEDESKSNAAETEMYDDDNAGCGLMAARDDDNSGGEISNKWSVTVSIPRDRTVEYRYFVCAVDPATEKVIVRRWETHFTPRQILPDAKDDASTNCRDVFGVIDDCEKIDRGWLTTETIVQLKFFNCPFTWKQRMKRRLLYVKITPMNLKIPSACDSNPMAASYVSTLDDSLSGDTHDTRENGADLSTAFAFSEVVSCSNADSEIHPQPQFGTACGPDDLVIFHLTVGDFENTAYLVDLYTYSSKAAQDEPPYHLGYHYVLPNLFKRSEGSLEIPVTCASKHRPLGMMNVGYLIIKPRSSGVCKDMRVSYQRYWNHKWKGLDVGHRGSGTSFKTNDSVIRENTITSLKNAVEHGADMVEFDVQLSKDLVPVVYHDFMIYVSLKSKSTSQEHDFLALPMRELTLDQLKNLKVYHTAEGRSRETRCFHNDDLLEHQPFPTLADVLEAIDVHVGFNIEVKWSQRYKDGTMEEEFEHVVDRNLYVDCILDVVFRKACQRRIVFSCFDPDICTMLRFKQNRYPVMFLTLGRTEKFKKYMDPRGNTLEMAVFNSVAMELLGVVAHSEDLLRDPSQVNFAVDSGLVLFCWGDENNSKDTIRTLKGMGLHAIIYDKMDVLTSKEVKQSVFLLQAKESQNELFKLQALEMGKMYNGANSNVQTE